MLWELLNWSLTIKYSLVLNLGYPFLVGEVSYPSAEDTVYSQHRKPGVFRVSPMVWEIGVQLQVKSYQRLKKWYLMPPCLTFGFIMLYTHIINMLIYTYTYSYSITTTPQLRRMKEGRRKKTSLQIYFTSHFVRVRKGCSRLHVRGSWRPNINCNILTPLLWPSRCLSCSLDAGVHSIGVPEGPLGRVWLSLPHLVSSCLEPYWQLLFHCQLQLLLGLELNWVK